MATRNDRAWTRYLTERNLALDGRLHLVTAADLKAVTGREPRLLAKFDEPDQLPLGLRQAGYGLLPIRNGAYLLFPGDLFCDVPACPTTRGLTEALPFTLDTQGRGEGEAQYIDQAFNAGLIEQFTGSRPLYLTIRGRERAGPFRFHLGGDSVTVEGVQIEVDAGYEGRDAIVLVEAKIGCPSRVNVRQLYYPWRHFRALVPHKTVRPLLLTYDMATTRYELHEYTFATTEDPLSWHCLRSAGYRLHDPEQRRLDELWEPELQHPSDLVPQADDFNRIVRLLAILDDGLDRTAAIADELGVVERQAQYYAKAAEYLGFVQPGSYWLTDRGREVLRAGPRRRRELLARAVVNSWIVAELVRRGQPLTAETIGQVIAGVPDEHGRGRYGPTTIHRRGRTLLAWLRWLADETGCVRRVGEGFEVS